MPLEGYLSTPVTSDEEDDMIADRSPASARLVGGVLRTGGELGTLTELAWNEAERQASGQAQLVGLKPRSPTLSGGEATRRFGIEGALEFDRPVTEEEAAWRFEAKRDELMRRDILSRNTSHGPLTAFAVAMGGGLTDPITMPLNIIPGLGGGFFLERFGVTALAQTSRVGALTRGLIGGATDGFALGLVVEGATYGLAGAREGRDYDMEDFATGLALNTLFGAAVAGPLEATGWRQPKVAFRDGLGAGNPIAGKIRAEAASQGVNPDLAVGIGIVESGLRPGADNPESSAGGVFQFIDKTWNKMGGGDKFDADLNIRRGVTLIRQNTDGLRRALKREPEAWEVYLAHQQGLGGATQLLRDPSRPAVDALRAAGVANPAEAVRLNGGRVDMTAGEFAALWQKRFNDKTGATSGGVGGETRAETPAEAAPDQLPAVNTLLEDEARAGAFAKAIEDMADDQPVNVGQLIDDELDAAPPPKPLLDETNGEITLPSRLLDHDVAVTVRGTEVPVRYAIADLRGLTTSHDGDLVANPDYPAELQPRDRDRAGSQARLLRMEREFNPRRLMASPDAESGAPIAAGDGVVESGNGRIIMLRRNAERGTEVYGRYKAELERRGYDLTGFGMPVLVRIRTQPMEGGARLRLAREMNADVTERLSATEQAFEDAKVLSDQDIGMFMGGEVTAAANRRFAQVFGEKAGAGQENALVDGKTKALTQEGARRIEAALLARAYGDKGLVAAVFETTDERIRAIGQALTAAAPDWASMRAAQGRGELAPGVDITTHVTTAVDLVRHARERGLDLKELVDVRRDQVEMFGAERLTVETEWVLRLFYRDEGLKRPTAAATIADALRDYARQASETTPGVNLFGETDAGSAQRILAHAVERWREGSALEQLDLGERNGPPAADAGQRQPEPGGPAGERPGSEVRPEDRGEPAGPSGPARPQLERLDRAALAADDPEITRLQASLLALDDDLDPKAVEAELEGVRAAAWCIKEAGA